MRFLINGLAVIGVATILYLLWVIWVYATSERIYPTYKDDSCS